MRGEREDDEIATVPQGYIDGWSLDEVRGWAVDPANPTVPATVALLIDNVPVVTASAADPREDVVRAGLAQGGCGFRLPLHGIAREVKEAYSNDRPPMVVLMPSRASLGLVPEPVVQPATESPPAVPAARGRFHGSILVQGPVIGDYSIALVNREFAKGLIPSSDAVTCYSTEPNVDIDPLFQAEASLVERFSATARSEDFDVHTFFSWPPDVDHMKAGLNVLHCYCWEESEFPLEFVKQFNAHLQLITTMSDFTKIVLENAGVTVPIVTIGSGIDHLEAIVPVAIPGLSPDRFRFLHVSSCFARKGADVLLRAFAEEFTADEPVELLIKTFDNIHNEIDLQLAEVRAAHPRLASIHVCKQQFAPPEMRWLYESSRCVVLPTRGEGFLLPAAEAMLLGIPVVTTAYSGQTDFCNEQTAWMVDVALAPSRSHMHLANSLWAEPDVKSLRRRMREVYQAGADQLDPKLAFARHTIASRYRWSEVAKRFIEAVNARRDSLSAAASDSRAHKLGIVSTWNQNCGISTYARHVVDETPRGFSINVLAEDIPQHGTDEPFVERVWLRSEEGCRYLADTIVSSDLRSVLFQHHPGLMSWPSLGRLIEFAAAVGKHPFVELHSTREGHSDLLAIAPALLKCRAIFVHTTDDVVNLGRIALQVRVVLVPHGVNAESGRFLKRKMSRTGLHIGAFGFLMPHKGVAEHLEALHLLRRRIPKLRATLLHSLSEDPKTIRYAAHCFELRERLGLQDVVDLQTQFLPIEEIRKRLSACDIAMFPYKNNGESASGAIRSLTGLGLPMICSPSRVFDDMRGICHTTAGFEPFDLASALHRVATDPAERERLLTAQSDFIQRYAWPNVMQRIFTVIDRLAPAANNGVATSPLVVDAAA
jgi:glycosyltransferase involved in cell wall biosynthesis